MALGLNLVHSEWRYAVRLHAPPAYFASELKVSTFRRVRFCYQIILSANWTILALVVVENILPHCVGAPVSLKYPYRRDLWQRKVRAMRTLKISARKLHVEVFRNPSDGLF